jgi:hypothetical protein
MAYCHRSFIKRKEGKTKIIFLIKIDSICGHYMNAYKLDAN